MLKTELAELMRNGENSGVEFKRDDVRPEHVAQEIVAMANLQGGYVLLGVEDDGTPSGLARETRRAEEWVMTLCRDLVTPPLIPYWETVQWKPGTVIGIISLPRDCPDKPYKVKRGAAWVTYVRIGSTSRAATREEEARLYQASGLMRYDIRPVSGQTLADLDIRRLGNYFRQIRGQDCPEAKDQQAWEQLLLGTDFMVEDRGRAVPTVAGVLLFGRNPHRWLPQSGITAVAYSGLDKDYANRERALIRGPIVPLIGPDNTIIESGVIDQGLDFVRRNSAGEAWIDEEGRRQERWKDFPLEAVREVIVNAVAHRDYTIMGTDIELGLYSNRLEVVSPGALPNTVTVEKMRRGYRATRNELIKEVLRDYRYIEATGLGVPRKIIRGMLDHNGTEPDLIEEEDRFIVRLYNGN